MTNGEKIKEIFPNIDNRLDAKTGIMIIKWVDNTTKFFKTSWWNAEYKEPMSSVTPQEPIEKCKWIKYDYRTICPKEHIVDNPYWRIPENRMYALKYCPYCGKEIEVEE